MNEDQDYRDGDNGDDEKPPKQKLSTPDRRRFALHMKYKGFDPRPGHGDTYHRMQSDIFNTDLEFYGTARSRRRELFYRLTKRWRKGKQGVDEIFSLVGDKPPTTDESKPPSHSQETFRTPPPQVDVDSSDDEDSPPVLSAQKKRKDIMDPPDAIETIQVPASDSDVVVNTLLSCNVVHNNALDYGMWYL